MRRIPIKQGYANKDAVLYYSGEYMITNIKYHLFLVANHSGVIYDSLIIPLESAQFIGDKLIIISDIKETFEKLEI